MIGRALLAAAAGALLLVPLDAAVPQPATVVVVPPVNQAARNRFPNADPATIDAITWVNALVNAVITYQDDRSHYGVAEKWVTWPADLKGDCEDYALSKMEMLRQGGWPTISRARIRALLVPDGKGGHAGHAVLELLLDSGETAILDNNFAEPMRRAELEGAYGYRFYDW